MQFLIYKQERDEFVNLILEPELSVRIMVSHEFNREAVASVTAAKNSQSPL